MKLILKILGSSINNLFYNQPDILASTSQTTMTEWNFVHHLANDIERYIFQLTVLSNSKHNWTITIFDQEKSRDKISSHGKMEQLVTPSNQHIANQIQALVGQIFSVTQSEDYSENPEKQAKVKEYERQIDQLVYKLYGLTEEEIKIVEGGIYV